MINTAIIRESVEMILMHDPLNRNATTLLRLMQRLGPVITDEAARGHGLQKRLAAALKTVPAPQWTEEERALLGRALAAAEGQSIRDQRLQVRLTADELQRIQEAAEAIGQDVSAYVRNKLGLGETHDA